MKSKYLIAAVLATVILAAPYLIIQSVNALYQTGLAFGWDPVAAGMASALLTFSSVFAAIPATLSFVFD